MTCCEPTTTPSGCCSIHGTVPGGIGVRWDSTGVSSPSNGVEIPVFQADALAGASALTITSSDRLWISWLQVVVNTGGETIVYRGTASGAHTSANAIIAGGVFGDNGGVVMSPPWVRLAAGERLWIVTANDDPYKLVGYGIREALTT